MAKPTTLPAGKLLIQIGDGGDPVETFTAPCGLTTKGFNQTASTQETTVPDCDDPDAPAYTERAVDALSGEVSGSGVLAMESLATYRAFFAGGLSKNVRIKLDNDDLGGYWEGPFLLTTFNVTAQRGQKANVELTLQSDGEWDWVDAA